MIRQLDPALLARITNGEGTRPTPAPVPPPGLYWIKTTHRGFYWVDKTGLRLDQPSHNEIWSVQTWELSTVSEWFLIRVINDVGNYEAMSSDEIGYWERQSEVVTHVSERIEDPNE